MKKLSAILISIGFLCLVASIGIAYAQETEVEGDRLDNLLEEILDNRLDSMEEAYEPILEDEENEDLFRFWGDLDFYPLMISGLNLESSGEYEDAIAEFEAALDIQLWERDNFEPLFDLGRVNFRLERFEDAKDYLEEYIERVEVQLDPDVEQDFGLSEEYIEELEGTVECAEILLDEIDEIDETETVAEENETED